MTQDEIVSLAFSCLRAHEAEVMTQLARSQSTLKENNKKTTTHTIASQLHVLIDTVVKETQHVYTT